MQKHLARLDFATLFEQDRRKSGCSTATKFPQELPGLLNSFEDTYVGRHNRQGNALFLPELLNLYQRTFNREDCTNNHAEAAHHRLKYELSMEYPTTWNLIDWLHEVQKGRDAYCEMLRTGHEPSRKLKSIEMKLEEYIKLLLDMKTDAVEYLRSISHYYQMKN